MRRNLALGIDIGGTKVLAAIVDVSTGEVLDRVRRATPASEGPAQILETAAGTARSVLRTTGASVTTCGVGTAGTLDEHGVVASATDVLPGWTGTDVSGTLEEVLGLPVYALNDGHATALGEACLGAGRGEPDVLVVAIGTGIGAGFIHDGNVVTGRRGSFASVGHVLADPRGPRCSCGAYGHLEALASGPALEEAYRAASGGPHLDLVAVQRLAEAADSVAASVFTEGGQVLGRTLAGVVNVLDIDMVVIGGGVGRAGDLLLAPLRSALAANLSDARHHVRVAQAALGTDACAIGAARFAARRAAAR